MYGAKLYELKEQKKEEKMKKSKQRVKKNSNHAIFFLLTMSMLRCFLIIIL